MTTAVGPEFLVNTSTAGDQGVPTISRLANGGFVVTWQDGGNSNFATIKAQVYDAAGKKVGSELLVNTDLTDDQVAPTITGLANGGFVITWQDDNNIIAGGSGQGIHAQMFDSIGRRVGSEFVVNSQPADFHSTPAITGLTNGGFAVAWQDRLFQGFDFDSSINVQMFDAGGNKVGSELLLAQVHPPTFYRGGLTNPTITHLSNGGFVVTWQDSLWAEGGTLNHNQVKAQVFDANGIAVGSEIVLRSDFAASPPTPLTMTVTGLSAGGFVAAWENHNPFLPINIFPPTINAQLFDADGNKVGGEFVASSQVGGFLGHPTVTDLANGGFAITWQDSSDTRDTSGQSIKAQVFDSHAEKIGSEFLVNTHTANDQVRPTIAGLTDGGFVVTWEDASGTLGDDSGHSIKAQIFSLKFPTYDFDGDGRSDLLWQQKDGLASISFMSGAEELGQANLRNNGPTWHAMSAGDFNGDHRADILWQNDSGQAAIWFMNGAVELGGVNLRNNGPQWHAVAAGDFNGDGKADILWQHDDGQAAIWFIDGTVELGGANLRNNGPSWHAVAAADFNGDGKADILWQHDDGQAAIWFMDGTAELGGANLRNNGPTWHAVAAADYNGDGKADIAWQNDNGQAAMWFMDGATELGGVNLAGRPDWLLT